MPTFKSIAATVATLAMRQMFSDGDKQSVPLPKHPLATALAMQWHIRWHI